MPSTASETFYDLAIRAIEEQEREVNSLRARTGTLVAAAAVAATLLARDISPAGWLAWTATVMGLAGLLIVLLASVYLLRSHDLPFSIDASAAYEEAVQFGAFDDDAPVQVQVALTYNLSLLRTENFATIERLRAAFATALAGLVIEILGLGLEAALA
jgi:hypothetical protein